MPGDFAISPVSQPVPGAPAAGHVDAAAPTAPPVPAASHGGTAAQLHAPSAAGGAASGAQAGGETHASLYANPVSQLDPALGIVVLSFYNAQGVQTSSIPSQKQLDSYRLHGDATAKATTGSAPGNAAAATASKDAAPVKPVSDSAD